jgi:hypothetical protein
MLKLILGILVVGILQFGFVIYSGLQEPMDIALAPVQTETKIPFPEPDFDAAPAAPAEELDDLDEEPAPAVSRTAARRPQASETASSQARSPRRHSARAVRETSVRPALTSEFRTVVISYHAPAERPAARRNCDPVESEKPKQRTAFAKADRPVARPWQVVTTFDPKAN